MSRKKKRTIPTEPPPPRPSKLRTAAICALLAVAVWAVFGQTLGHQFVNYDDDAYINIKVETA